MRTLKELIAMQGRISIVVGGAGYLGRAMAEALAEVGSQVIILDLEKSQAESVVEELSRKYDGKISFEAIDLSEKDSVVAVVEELASRLDKIDVLINCASLVGSSDLQGWATSFEKQDIYTWEKALEINLTGAFFLIQNLYPLLKKSDSASVINVSSIYGFAGQKPYIYEGMNYLTPAAYAVSKGGVIQLTRYLASVLAPIRVNCISPGGIERGQEPGFVQRYERITPLGRMGKEEDFKGVVLFLASKLSSYVTGQNIVVDGGWSL